MGHPVQLTCYLQIVEHNVVLRNKCSTFYHREPFPFSPSPDTQLQFRRTSKDSSLGNNNLKMNEKRLSADSEGKSWRKSSVVANPNVEASSPIADGKNSSIIQNKV